MVGRSRLSFAPGVGQNSAEVRQNSSVVRSRIARRFGQDVKERGPSTVRQAQARRAAVARAAQGSGSKGLRAGSFCYMN
jgi:hypothetical protein